jgi:radical SAM superfamily enzyme YgiQ (UPF0313 family)
MDTMLKPRMAPSLALLTLARLTPERHRLTITDENITPVDFEEHVDLMGITVTVDTSPRAYDIARRFREKGVKVVGGGIHASAVPEEAAQHFDAVCVGMAEGCWAQMLEDCENGCLQPVYRCTGMPGGQIASPLYGAVDGRQYLYTNTVSTSRGCPYACDFCYNSSANVTRYVNRPVEDVVNEIRGLKTRHVMFIDDNFIGNPAWTMEFLDAIAPLGLKWNAAVSTNVLQHPGLLDRMRETGCQSLFIGFESINPDSIECVHKRQNTVEAYDHIIGEIHKRGIMVNASLVFGLDHDTKAVFGDTLEWLVKNRVETMTAHILTPYPGTVLYRRLLEAGRITDFDRSRYNTANVVFAPAGMTPEELREGYLRMYRRFYTFGNIFRRMPQSKGQRVPFLLFNLLYRKFGKLACRLAMRFSFDALGRFARRRSYRIE